ncbi:hypothetical protein D3C73_1585940 [compost metagenome]
MNVRHQAIGFGGDDRTGSKLVALRISPYVIEAGHGKDTPVFQENPHRLFAAGLLLPVVETIGWDDTAA